MFDYDVSVLENFSFNSIRDVFALLAQNYQVTSKYDIERFKYKSYYLNAKKTYKIIPQSLIEKYCKEDSKKKISNKYAATGIPYGILSEKYNQLLNEKKQFTQIEGYTKTFLNQKIKDGDFDKVQDANYTNSYYPYAGLNNIADFSMYRRLRKDPYDMPIHEIMLILDASHFPLKMTMEFPEGSILYKKYKTIFNSIPSIYEQLMCYFSIEFISSKTLTLEIYNGVQSAYKSLIHGSIKFQTFEEIVNSLGAEVKISFVPEIIKTYNSYKVLVDEIFKDIYKAILNNDKKIVKSQILNGILKENPELEIAESLIKLEQLHQSSKLNNITQKKEADS